MEILKEEWSAFKHGSADDFYVNQFNNLLFHCAENNRLPYFAPSDNKVVNIINGNEAKDINKQTIALYCAANGYKSKAIIFGSDIAKLGLNIDSKAKPVLLLANGKYATRDAGNGDLHVKEVGTGKSAQWAYSVDALDPRSRKKLIENGFDLEQKNTTRSKDLEVLKKNFANPSLKMQMTATDEKFRVENEKNKLTALYITTRAAEMPGLKSPDTIRVYNFKIKEELLAFKENLDNGIGNKTDAMKAIANGVNISDRSFQPDFSFVQKKVNTERKVATRNLERSGYSMER